MKQLWEEYLKPALIIGLIMGVLFVIARLWICGALVCPEGNGP